MIRFQLLGFPIAIQPFFWITMAILGNLNSPSIPGRQLNWEGMVIFAAVGFVSILIHELGHALSMRKHGGHNIRIELNGFGGLAFYNPDPNRPITRWQTIAISAAGPIYQLIAGLIAYVALYYYKQLGGDSTYIALILKPFYIISFFWGFLNLLLPIFPLDGGQILNGILGPKNIKITLITGLVICVALAIYSMISFFSFWNLMIIALLASQNIRMLQAIRVQENSGPPPPPQP